MLKRPDASSLVACFSLCTAVLALTCTP